MNPGMAIAARIPMIATTIISSIKVKPPRLLRIFNSPKKSRRGAPDSGTTRRQGKPSCELLAVHVVGGVVRLATGDHVGRHRADGRHLAVGGGDHPAVEHRV